MGRLMMRVLCLLFFSAGSVQAKEGCLQILENLFVEGHEMNYQAGFCASNVGRFLESARDRAALNSEVQVLLIQPLNRLGLFPRFARIRFEPHETWPLHFVATAYGKVFDLDLRVPRPLPATRYFRIMFPTQLDHIGVDILSPNELPPLVSNAHSLGFIGLSFPTVVKLRYKTPTPLPKFLEAIAR